MNNQIAFSKMVGHLRRQGKPSSSYMSGQVILSAYYGDDGCKCPVGALIPESLYKKEMECANIEELLPHFSDLKKFFKNVDTNLLIAMQELHDDKPVEIWESEFRKVAYQFKLSVPLED